VSRSSPFIGPLHVLESKESLKRSKLGRNDLRADRSDLLDLRISLILSSDVRTQCSTLLLHWIVTCCVIDPRFEGCSIGRTKIISLFTEIVVSNYSFLKLGKRSEVKPVKFRRVVSEIAFATLGESSIHLYHIMT